MNIQYLEMYRKEKRVYQGVTLGRRDTQNQMGIIMRNAAGLGSELVKQTGTSWEIVNKDSREVWGRVVLRDF